MTLSVKDDIIPLGELKAHTSRVLRTLRSTGRSIIVTQNGRPAAVVMTPEEYDVLSYRHRVVRAIGEGLDDLRDGRVTSDADLTKELDREFGPAR
jgi:prevent-host-death family protein